MEIKYAWRNEWRDDSTTSWRKFIRKENSVEIVESEEDELEESTEKESFDMLGTNNIALNAQIFSSIAAQDNVLRMNKNSKEK